MLDDAPTRSMDGPPDTGAGRRQPVQVFGNYQIIEELPRGGQAVVYKALHRPTNTKVAIKVLLPSMLASQRARYYFEREAELIAGLDHPGIVKIRDSGIIQGQYFFVMEYIEGLSLDSYFQRQNLSFRQKVLLFEKVCSAVSYAHQQGIIHRDLKFANILVDGRGEPHILDFGLAKAISLSDRDRPDAMPTITGQWAGSLSSMSPEQASARPELIDVRSDVYSLGVILYRMLAGRYPYDIGGATLEVLRLIQEAEPARPRRFIRGFDADMEAVLLTALAKERERRYQSVADLKNDIDNWLAGRPIRVRSVSTLYLLRKIVWRHRYASGVAVLLLMIVLGFSYTSFDLYITARKAKLESDAIAGQWAAQADRYLDWSRQVTFMYILQAWQAGRGREAVAISSLLTEGSREKTAAAFLTAPGASAAAETEFRRRLGADYGWLADFVIGERRLREGRRRGALEAFRHSRRALGGLSKDKIPADARWLAVRLAGRLAELETNGRPEDEEPAGGGER